MAFQIYRVTDTDGSQKFFQHAKYALREIQMIYSKVNNLSLDDTKHDWPFDENDVVFEEYQDYMKILFSESSGSVKLDVLFFEDDRANEDFDFSSDED